MKRKSSHKGIIALLVLIIIVLTALLLKNVFFGRDYQCYLIWEDSSTAPPKGSVVSLKGLEIGRIMELDLMADGNIIMQTRLPLEIGIPDDSYYYLSDIRDTGPLMLEVVPGKSENMLNKGDTIYCLPVKKNKETLPERIGDLKDVVDGMRNAIDSILINNNDAGEKSMHKSTPANQSSNIIFRVQFAVLSLEKGKEAFSLEDADAIKIIKENGVYKYYYGHAYSMQQAEKLKDQLIAAGYKGAFVTAWENGHRIKLDEALRKTTK